MKTIEVKNLTIKEIQNSIIQHMALLVYDEDIKKEDEENGELLLDVQTCNAINVIYDALNDSNKKRLEKQITTLYGLYKVSKFAWSKVV